MKWRKAFFLLLLLPVCSFIFSQKSYRLNFQIDQLPYEKVRLIFYYGDQQIRQDSGVTDVKGHIVFMLNENNEVGIYKLEKDKDKGLDFIFNKENVSIVADQDLGMNNLIVEESSENRIFFDYYHHKYDMETRIDVLSGFLNYYPRSDTFYDAAAMHSGNLVSAYSNYLDSLLNNFPDMLVTRIIRLDQLPDIRPGELDPMAIEKYRSSYFDSVDLTDSLVLNTPLLPVKVIDYLSLYVIPGASREVQEKNFMQAVDSLMKFTEGGPEVREMIVNYLINGFQAYGFETVMTYLVENYVLGQKCVSDQQEEKLRIRIEGFKKLAVGSPAPLFEISDSKGNLVRLADNKEQKTLLIFWSGNCPHCEAMLPELVAIYGQYGEEVRFIGISVDQDENVWHKAMKNSGLPWVNVAELKGWDGKIIQDYYIYATPTFILIDPDLKIKAKPAGLAELKGDLMD